MPARSLFFIVALGLVGLFFFAGSAAAKVFWGNDNANHFVGTPDPDTFYMGKGGDIAEGRRSGDELNLGNGDDWGAGDAGDDRIWGDDARDVLQGDTGREGLHGGGGVDVLNVVVGSSEDAYGGDGDDWVDVESPADAESTPYNDDAWGGGGIDDTCKIDFRTISTPDGITVLKDGTHGCENIIRN